jgi:uncharacterized protein involved in outer membrane biogenesis
MVPLPSIASDTAVRTHAPSRAGPPGPPRAPRRLRWGAALGGVVVLALIVFLILFRWNWLRGPLAHEISARTHRPVSITGDLEVHPWSLSPSATVNGLVIGNARWAGPGPLASLPRLTVRVKLPPLLAGKVILPLVEADRPKVDLLRDASGRANWVANPGAPPTPLRLPAINDLVIKDGALTYNDRRRKLDFAGVVSSNESLNGQRHGVFLLRGQGRLNGQPFTAHVTGGPLIDVDPARPYDFEGRIQAGDTRVRLSGRFAHPFDFAAVSGQAYLAGPDLADLYLLTGITLPNTPPYSLSAGFGRRGAHYALSGIRGLLGASDLEGSLSVDDSTGRPFVKADLASRRLRLADLAAVIGGVPRTAAGHRLSPSQQIEYARLRAEHRVLPDAHLDVTRVRGMDARLDYRAASVEAGRTPIKALTLGLTLDHGVLTADPLDVTLPEGRLAGTIRIDARRDIPADAIDLRLTGGRLENLMAAKGAGPPALAGGLYARARLSGVGDSVRSAAASANGAVTAVVPDGEIRQTFAELLGIDVTRGLYLLLTKSHKDTPIRCGVADFQARAGVLTADRLVLDTGVVTVTGSGDIDLRDESLDLSLKGKPKSFRLVRLSAPVTIKGDLAEPRIGVDVAKAAPQAAIGAAIGVFAAPVAAILPFVNPGLAKNADCAALLTQASDKGVRLRHR